MTTDGLDRPPPHNDEAERSVLGSILIEAGQLHKVSGWLGERDFYSKQNAAVYAALLAMDRENKPIDLLTVCDKISHEIDSPGVAYVASLVDGVPDVANVAYYGGIVRRDADRRRAIQMCEHAIGSFWTGQDVAGTAAGLLDAAVTLVDRSKDVKATESARRLMTQGITELEARIAGDAEVSGITTGYRSLDAATRGYPRGAVTIVGAPPKVGKTTFMLNGALAAAEAGYGVLYFSIDMPKMFVRDRLMSIVSGIDSDFIKTGSFTGRGLYEGMTRNDALDAVMAGAQRIASMPGTLDVNDVATDLAEIISECTVRAKAGTLDLVMVDFVQQVGSQAFRTDSEHRRITHVANSIKNMARKLNIAAVLAAQPNRTLQTGERMTMRHLAESSSLEQIPRVALMLHRPGAYSGSESLPCDLTICIDKNEGETGDIPLHAEMHCYRITERVHDDSCVFESYRRRT